MVRMSDLVRGIVREPAPAPKPAPPAEAPPAEAAERPVVVPTARVSIATSERPEPVVRVEPPLPAPRGRVEPSEPSEPLFGELQRFLVEARERVNSPGFPWIRLDALIDRAITSLMQSPDLFWIANHPAAPPGVDFLAFHQARVCVLSLRLGVNLGYDRARLMPLGVAAALFDVGLWQLPTQMIERPDALSGNELATYRTHPRLSADIVQRWSPPDVRILDAILDHHEREQGQGFPRGLQGSSIDPDAKIIGLVDTYTALTLPPSSRPRQRPHEAIRDIVKTRNDQFPSPLIKVLLSEISVFPPGTIVRLNTEEVGRVIAVNRNHPLRPQVELVADGKGQRLGAPKVIDLSEAPFLYITGPVGDGPR
jgi:HD domain-containing protein